MTRYIDAEEAENVLINRMAGTGYQSRAVDSIAFVPTADVEDVRHGEWKFNNHACGYYYSGVTCSICGNGETSNSPYCRKCGAKMDGGNNDQTN